MSSVFRAHAFRIELKSPAQRAASVLMSARQLGPYDNVARKWLALAERRRAHVIELRESGRWRHYYTPDEFLDALSEAINSRDEWARLAGLESGEASA